jgi:hypothetical protein
VIYAVPLGLVLLVLAPACNKEGPKAAEEPRAAAAPAPAPAPVQQEEGPTRPAVAALSPAAEAAPAGAQAPAQVSEESFDLKISGSSGYESGKPAEATITLDAKPPFHINDKYPYKFKLKEAAGLKFPSPVVGKDAAKLEKQRMTMAVAFTPESAGKHTLSGVLAFSVCTDDKCLIEKRDLAFDVQSK